MDTKDISELRRRRATLSAELKSADARIAAVEAACRHDWGPTVQSSESHVDLEPDMARPVHRGSDMWYETRAIERQRPVWTRTCRSCLREERTTEQREVVTRSAEPAFRG